MLIGSANLLEMTSKGPESVSGYTPTFELLGWNDSKFGKRQSKAERKSHLSHGHILTISSSIRYPVRGP